LIQKTIDIGSIRDLVPLKRRNDAETFELSIVPFAQIDTDRPLVFTFLNIGFAKFIDYLVNVSLAGEGTRLVVKHFSLVGKVLPFGALPRIYEFAAPRAVVIIQFMHCFLYGNVGSVRI
jgi:hypothetical protein